MLSRVSAPLAGIGAAKSLTKNGYFRDPQMGLEGLSPRRFTRAERRQLGQAARFSRDRPKLAKKKPSGVVERRVTAGGLHVSGGL